MKKLVEITDGFSGAEIEEVCNRASLYGVKRFVESKEKSVKTIKVTQKDFETSIEKIKKIKPS